MSPLSAMLLAVGGAGVTVIAQLLLKAAALKSRHKGLLGVWWTPLGLIVGTLFLAVTLLNLAAFRVLPLKIGVALHPLVVAGIVIGSRVVFGERLSRSALFGLGLIAAGIGLFFASGW